MKYFFSFMLFIFICTIKSDAQTYIVKNIKEFGAKGDGRTSDHKAFQKAAAFFNTRGGNGKLIIPRGIYIVGKQSFTGGQLNKPAWEGENVLHFKNIKNVDIEGEKESIIKYADNLRFGTFNPINGQPYEHSLRPFVDMSYAGYIGFCLFLENVNEVKISGLTIDGNSDNVILGGVFGDVDRQLAHYGVYILNSRNISIDSVNVHHSALDGISIANQKSDLPDNIQITNSAFEYNARQGLSWIGGNYLYVKNTKFNHTGKGKFGTAPGAGVDIEAEVGPVRNGIFDDCEFINNIGSGVAADSGDGGYCTFNNSTFWGVTNFSIWVNKPGFTFNKCNIYGSMVHGYDAPDDRSATKFISCHFEDKRYKGQEVFGKYLVESNYRKRMLFQSCTFTANEKKICWLDSPGSFTTEEKYQLLNCVFNINNTNLPQNDFVGLMRGTVRKDCTFIFNDPKAVQKQYYIGGFGEASNVDGGGNKVVVK